VFFLITSTRIAGKILNATKATPISAHFKKKITTRPKNQLKKASDKRIIFHQTV
jgi:hypothetical protein